MLSYCEYVLAHPEDEFNRVYHDAEYGYPLDDDNKLFERLILEINQAGLSWLTILKKKDNFQKAYSNFDIQTVAAYGPDDISRLLTDKGIIRNNLKIKAAIENARVIQQLQNVHGSFKNWLDTNIQNTLEEWIKEFKRNFRFTGKQIVKEFLMSTGYMPGSHDKDCPVYPLILKQQPPWFKFNIRHEQFFSDERFPKEID